MIAGIDLINTSGFHAMEEDIEAAQSMDDVSSGNLGRTKNTLAAVRAVSWPEELGEPLHHFEESTQALADALSVGDLQAAKEASGEIHDVTCHSVPWQRV